MRAVVLRETGGPEVLRLVEWPEPEPGEGEVLVRVEAAAVNRFDVNQRAGGATRLPTVLGQDAAGARVDTGERVVVTSARGTYAELTVARTQNVYPLAEGVSASVAAAVPTPYRAAWWALERAGLASGATLLVQGGSSSTGQAAIDLACAQGATVFATGSVKKHGRLRELGAEPLVYDDPRIAELGADVVFEPLGARTFESSIEALGRDGRLVTPGAVGDANVSLSVWALVGKRARLEGISAQDAPPEAVARLLEMVARAELHPFVERELPLEQAAEAHRLIEANEVTGRIVLRP